MQFGMVSISRICLSPHTNSWSRLHLEFERNPLIEYHLFHFLPIFEGGDYNAIAAST